MVAEGLVEKYSSAFVSPLSIDEEPLTRDIRRPTDVKNRYRNFIRANDVAIFDYYFE